MWFVWVSMSNTKNSGHSHHWLESAFSHLLLTGEPPFLLFSVCNKFTKWKLSFYCAMTGCMKRRHLLRDGRITCLSSSCTSFKISALINMPSFFTEWDSRQPLRPSRLGWHCANKCLKLHKCSLFLAEYEKKSQILVYGHINISPFPKYTILKWL